jgi:hypothetical protein
LPELKKDSRISNPHIWVLRLRSTQWYLKLSRF